MQIRITKRFLNNALKGFSTIHKKPFEKVVRRLFVKPKIRLWKGWLFYQKTFMKPFEGYYIKPYCYGFVDNPQRVANETPCLKPLNNLSKTLNL